MSVFQRYLCKMEKLYSYASLRTFTRAVFEKIGCSVEHAETATNALLSADLRGVAFTRFASHNRT